MGGTEKLSDWLEVTFWHEHGGGGRCRAACVHCLIWRATKQSGDVTLIVYKETGKRRTNEALGGHCFLRHECGGLSQDSWHAVPTQKTAAVSVTGLIIVKALTGLHHRFGALLNWCYSLDCSMWTVANQKQILYSSRFSRSCVSAISDLITIPELLHLEAGPQLTSSATSRTSLSLYKMVILHCFLSTVWRNLMRWYCQNRLGYVQ